MGAEFQAHVVGRPVAVCIAESGREMLERFVQDGVAQIFWHAFEQAAAKHDQPGAHAGRQRGGAGNQLDGVDGEAGRFEEAAILGNGGEVVVFDH